MDALRDTLAAYAAAVEGALRDALAPDRADAAIPGLADFDAALRHAILAGGKRVRPCLTLLAARAFGLDDPTADPDARAAAAAIELLHGYTLVHDDLPAMDDDTLRRGQPTVWAKFGEATAILAGDGLQALAFARLAPTRAAPRLTAILAQAAIDVVRGQVADLADAAHPGRADAAHQAYVYANKTGALFRAAAALGAAAAGAGEAAGRDAGAFGMALGSLVQDTDARRDADQDRAAGHPAGTPPAAALDTHAAACGQALAAFPPGPATDLLRALVAHVRTRRA